MGLGGHLMWTAVFREIKKKRPAGKIIFTNPPSLKDRLFGKKYGVPVRSEVFVNNPYLSYPESIEDGDDLIVIHPNEDRYNYHSLILDDRVEFKPGHVIRIICREFNIEQPDLKCELYFSESETKKIEELVTNKIGNDFIVIEPHTKDYFTVNKGWYFNKWQAVVDQLVKNHLIVQVGTPGVEILDGVMSFVGELTFRESLALIGRGRLLFTSEGGLMHGANAVNTPSVVIFTGFNSPALTGYPENINLYSDIECSNCGLRKMCNIGWKCRDAITPTAVVEAANKLLSGAPSFK
ncbi:glycosyltransferase family 9 protein [Gemmatimonadota bacterium]